MEQNSQQSPQTTGRGRGRFRGRGKGRGGDAPNTTPIRPIDEPKKGDSSQKKAVFAAGRETIEAKKQQQKAKKEQPAAEEVIPIPALETVVPPVAPPDSTLVPDNPLVPIDGASLILPPPPNPQDVLLVQPDVVVDLPTELPPPPTGADDVKSEQPPLGQPPSGDFPPQPSSDEQPPSQLQNQGAKQDPSLSVKFNNPESPHPNIEDVPFGGNESSDSSVNLNPAEVKLNTPKHKKRHWLSHPLIWGVLAILATSGGLVASIWSVPITLAAAVVAAPLFTLVALGTTLLKLSDEWNQMSSKSNVGTIFWGSTTLLLLLVFALAVTAVLLPNVFSFIPVTDFIEHFMSTAFSQMGIELTSEAVGFISDTMITLIPLVLAIVTTERYITAKADAKGDGSEPHQVEPDVGNRLHGQEEPAPPISDPNLKKHHSSLLSQQQQREERPPANNSPAAASSNLNPGSGGD